MTTVARRLGEGIAGLVNVLDPEIVVVGGGVGDPGICLLEPAPGAFQASVEGADAARTLRSCRRRSGTTPARSAPRSWRSRPCRREARASSRRSPRSGAAAHGAGASGGRGYDAVFAPDHLFPPGAPVAPALEPFAFLAAVAARHPELHVGTLVSRASLRPAGILAKQAAALDQISGGRGILGLGAGDSVSKAEHEAFGIPFPSVSDRIALLAETVGAMRRLFVGETLEGGPTCRRSPGPCSPRAIRRVWVGGRSRSVIAVAARSADAWNGWAMDAEGFEAAAAELPQPRRRPRGLPHVGRDRPGRQRPHGTGAAP